MSIVKVEHVEILPINSPQDQTYSYKLGYPIVSFHIGSQSKFLDGKTLRLNGELVVLQNDGAAPSNNANRKTTGGGVVAVANPAPNNRVSVASCLQQLTLSTQDHQTLEVIRQYPRYLATAQTLTHSADDLNHNVAQQSATASRSLTCAQYVNVPVSFSMPLRCGMLSGGDPIPLGVNGSRGLQIQLELAPDFQVLGPWTNSEGENCDNNVTPAGAFYQLRNLSLSYDLHVPDEAGVVKMSNSSSGALSYNSVSHIYSVLNSSDQTVNLNLGTQRTLSVVHNTLPTSFINNPNQDGCSTPYLQSKTEVNNDYPKYELRKVSFSRGGVLFPIDSAIQAQNDSDNAHTMPQTEKTINYMNAVKPYDETNHTIISPNTQSGIRSALTVAGKPKEQGTYVDQNPCFGLGVREDPYRVGVDFSKTNYAVRVESELPGDEPNSLFTYVLAANQLMYSPQGIQVMN